MVLNNIVPPYILVRMKWWMFFNNMEVILLKRILALCSGCISRDW